MSPQEKQTRNWEGIKEFFELKKIELTDMGVIVNKDAVSSEEKLIHRQVNQIVFFRDHLESPTTASKMKYTPLTNSGSESRMAQLDVKVNFSGGQHLWTQ